MIEEYIYLTKYRFCFNYLDFAEKGATFGQICNTTENMSNIYVPRLITKEVQESAKEYPIITIIGPRQSGKTTLAKKLFENLPSL